MGALPKSSKEILPEVQGRFASQEKGEAEVKSDDEDNKEPPLPPEFRYCRQEQAHYEFGRMRQEAFVQAHRSSVQGRNELGQLREGVALRPSHTNRCV